MQRLIKPITGSGIMQQIHSFSLTHPEAEHPGPHHLGGCSRWPSRNPPAGGHLRQMCCWFAGPPGKTVRLHSPAVWRCCTDGCRSHRCAASWSAPGAGTRRTPPGPRWRAYNQSPGFCVKPSQGFKRPKTASHHSRPTLTAVLRV